AGCRNEREGNAAPTASRRGAAPRAACRGCVRRARALRRCSGRRTADGVRTSRRFHMLRVMTLDEFMAQLPKGDLWIFGYGSLMWSPGFSYQKKTLGRVHGYHRALCILSTRYRGTKRKPGLVMGLCRGGSCWGMAFRVDAARVRHALTRLWQREMPRRVYAPRLLKVQLD